MLIAAADSRQSDNYNELIIFWVGSECEVTELNVSPRRKTTGGWFYNCRPVVVRTSEAQAQGWRYYDYLSKRVRKRGCTDCDLNLERRANVKWKRHRGSKSLWWLRPAPRKCETALAGWCLSQVDLFPETQYEKVTMKATKVELVVKCL